MPCKPQLERPMPRDVLKRRWLYLLLGFACMFFIGIIYAWSIVKVPLAEEFGWSVTELALAYTVSMCFYCIGSVGGAFLGKKVRPAWVFLAAGVMICMGYLLLTRIKSGHILYLHLFYSVLVGLGIGAAYNTAISVVCDWFPDKKGTASGALMMGFGLSTMFLGKAVAKMIAVSAIGWRTTFAVLGVLILAILSLCAAFLHRPGADNLLPAAKVKSKTQEAGFGQREYSTAEALRRPSYWLFYVFGLLSASVGSTVISFARDIAVSVGAEVMLATSLVGILSLCNGGGRILCGIVYDTWGRRRTMLLFSILTVLAPACMLGAIVMKSLPLVILSFCLTGLSYGGCPTISSAFIASAYGKKDFAVNYGIGNTKVLFSSFAATAAGALYAQTGSFLVPFFMLLGLSIIALVLNCLIKKP